MRVAYLTTADPIYLPDFFERVLDRSASSTVAVYVVPPLYKDQTTRQAAWRYYRTFGWEGVRGLGTRTLRAKVAGRSIESHCARRGIHCEDVPDVNAPVFLDRLRALAPDVLVSVSCPQIFRRPLIDLAPLGCLNIHGAILPQYRGVMPSFWMLANGERRAGVSIYFVNDAIDAGELCAQRKFEIMADDTLDSFLRRSKAIAADLLLEVLDRLERGTVARTPLDLARGSYYSWPDGEAVARFRAAGRRLW